MSSTRYEFLRGAMDLDEQSRLEVETFVRQGFHVGERFVCLGVYLGLRRVWAVFDLPEDQALMKGSDSRASFDKWRSQARELSEAVSL